MRSKNKGYRIGILLLTVSVLLISSGVYMGYISNPKRIIATAMQELTSAIYPTYINNNNQKTNPLETDNFTINSKIRLSVTSKYLEEKVLIEPTYIPYNNFLKNISNTENTINLIQDNKNKKLLLNLNSNLNNQSFINTKLLIQDATEYYYISNFKDNYINNGNNSYFEAISKEKTTNENIKYLYEYISLAFKNNLKEEYFTTAEVNTSINNIEKEYQKISLKINNSNLKEIIKDVLNDLKNDKESSKILKSLNIDLSKLNLTKNDKLLSDNSHIIFNVYTDKISYKIKKHELVLDNGDNFIKIAYEYGDTNKGYILKDNELLCNYTVIQNSTSTKINLLSKYSKNIGSIIFEKRTNSYEIILNYNDGIYGATGNYKLEKSKINSKAYSILQQLSLRVVDRKTELINLNYIMDTNVEHKAKISEDVSTSIFQSSITDLEKETFKTQNILNLNRLFG